MCLAEVRISAFLCISCSKVGFQTTVKTPIFATMEQTYRVSARSYRPEHWDSVVGQKSIKSTLKNAIASDHIAQAYLFCGPRGVGKTTCARIFAKAINNLLPASDSGEQVNFTIDKKATDHDDFAFNIFELDAASNNSVDDIRSITDQVRIPPQQHKYKVYIIDEVHMLSPNAFNAFLKTLEEPPPHAIFILATTEKHKIIPTILSRCQIFDFSRISIADMSEHLGMIAKREGITVEPEALHVIAQKADGALRDALSIFDQVVAFSGNNLTYQSVIQNLNILDYDYYFKVTDALLDGDIPKSLVTFDEILDHGFDGHLFVAGLGEHLRDLMVSKDPSTLKLMEVTEGVAERYAEQAQRPDLHWLIQAMDILNTADVQYKTSKNQRLLVELALMQICSLTSQDEVEKKKSSNLRLIPILKERDLRPSLPSRKAATKPQAAPQDSALAAAKPEPIAAPTGIRKKKAMQLAPHDRFRLRDELGSSEKQEDGTSEESIETESRPSKTVTQEDLLAAWDLYANSLNELGKKSLYSTLKADKPKLEGTQIHMVLSNTIQEMEILDMKADMMEFLRNHLQNFELDIVTEVRKGDDSKVHLYSDKEKYEAMKEKNPALEELRKRLNLDLEF